MQSFTGYPFQGSTGLQPLPDEAAAPYTYTNGDGNNGNEEEEQANHALPSSALSSAWQCGTASYPASDGNCIMQVPSTVDCNGDYSNYTSPAATSYGSSAYYGDEGSSGNRSSRFYMWRPPALSGNNSGGGGSPGDSVFDGAGSEGTGALAIPASVALHPLAAAALKQRLLEAQRRSPNGQLDALAAALLCRQQQAEEGQPRSPLSPRTLQQYVSALAEGRAFTLTPESLLAPPPLALPWHQSRTAAEEDDNKSDNNGWLQDSRVEVLAEEDGEESGTGNAMRGWRGQRQRQKRARSGTFGPIAGDGHTSAVNGNAHCRYQSHSTGTGGGGNSEGGMGFDVEPILRRPRTSFEQGHDDRSYVFPSAQGSPAALGAPWRSGDGAGAEARKRERDDTAADEQREHQERRLR